MKKAALMVLCNWIGLLTMAQTGYWQQQVNYNMAVTLNDAEHELTGVAKMEYFNNSPDTLSFIWVHLWPNAYKNDRTALTDQLLEQGNTKFYFSDEEQRGYINRLNFKVNGTIAQMLDHPQHQDILKVVLPAPLPPGQHCSIETPFHVKLPLNISRGGHIGQSYQLTQWYPKVAVYDRKGWHPMPYLDQGEFYSDFGEYEVSINVPKAYKVAATGVFVDSTVKADRKILRYEQGQVIDFAWFADKNFIVQQDTCALPSGTIVQVAAYSLPPEKSNCWQNAVQYIKHTLRTRSQLIGEYPYSNATVVQGPMPYRGGLEYPTITLISGAENDRDLEGTIEHEVGHNWFYGILASNERAHPWMDEGMNSYYDGRYQHLSASTSSAPKKEDAFMQKRVPANTSEFMLQLAIGQHSDQPIETNSVDFTAINYGLSAYYKASRFMAYLEQLLGTAVFDRCMKAYYSRWQFRHPYPEDFKKVIEEISGQNLDAAFAALQANGALPVMNNAITKKPRALKLMSFFSFKDTDKYKYIFVSPALGYNKYDKLMVGLSIHNYTFPQERLQFLVAPLYATGSKQFNGVGALNYHWFPTTHFSRIDAGFNTARFSGNQSLDSNRKNVFENYVRTTPFVRLHFRHSARSQVSSYVDIRSIVLSERFFEGFVNKVGPDSAIGFVDGTATGTRSIQQLTFFVQNSRALYPYDYQLQVQQGKGFYRINATGNYFFNYAKGGGMQVRVFAAKFGFMGKGDQLTSLYQPKLLAGNGADDYTNSNYFIGRTASTAFGENVALKNGGIATQQIMIQNTGGLKLRIDPYASVQGYSENWVAAANFNTTIPDRFLSMFPVKLPLRLFFDVGSYAEAWGKNPPTPKFLYTGGLQLSLFKNVLNVYVPLLYSSIFKDQLKSDVEANKFLKKITFSIDFQQMTLKKLLPSIAL